MSLFRNKYQIESSRKPDWDYSSNATYFITICTYQKQHFFGKFVDDNKMVLSEVGLLAEEFLVGINSHFRHARTNCHMIMPNHIHSIIVLDKPPLFAESVSPIFNSSADEDIFLSGPQASQCSDDKNNVEEYMRSISPKAGSLSTIIRSYRSAVTKHARNINPEFAWQTGYHDHIIRNNDSYFTIRNYIINNPKTGKRINFICDYLCLRCCSATSLHRNVKYILFHIEKSE